MIRPNAAASLEVPFEFYVKQMAMIAPSISLAVSIGSRLTHEALGKSRMTCYDQAKETVFLQVRLS